MRYVAMIAGMLALTSCATASVMRMEPRYTLTNAESPDALEECISLTMPGAKTIRGDGRRTITFGNYANTVATATITYGSPNIIEVRSTIVFKKQFDRRLRECAERGTYNS